MSNLEILPKEIVALIASFSTASSALNLSATCRTIRAASWDILTLKNILVTSQDENWNDESLDIDAIASRAGDDINVWARYALADERAASLADSVSDDPTWPNQRDHPLKLPQSYISYLPEIFVLKHPFMAEELWDTAVLYQRQANSSQIFCLIMTVLASKQSMYNLITRLYNVRSDWFVHSTDTGAYLWALCTIALWARTKIQQRLAAWPYNAEARIPFIPIPNAHQIPLRPFNDSYSLPAPFSRRPSELLGNPRSSFSSWDGWYRLHCLAALNSLTEGSWCGYYIHFGVQSEINAPLDAPMMDIKFELDNPTDTTQTFNDVEVLHFHAKDCIDSIDSFDIKGSVILVDNDVKITARKAYQNRHLSWDWDCRLTPFGIVGFWGRPLRRSQRSAHGAGARFWDHRNANSRDQESLDRAGILWLWKKAWIEENLDRKLAGLKLR